jgi:hypothetical protein
MNNKGMEKNNKIMDDRFRELLAGTKIVADENLKYRIMRQIQTECLLVRSHCKKERKINRRIFNLLSVAVISYILTGCTAVFFYFLYGAEMVLLPEFYMAVTFIVVVSTVFAAIGFYDEKLRAGLKKG